MYIAIVEDSDTQRSHLSEVISTLGHNPKEYSNGIELIEEIGEISFDLLVLDIDMPELDGLRTAQVVKSSQSRRIRETPIIILTASQSPLDRSWASVSKANSFLYKPVDRATLKEAILRVSNG